MEIKIGQRFMKRINNGKMIECEITDIVIRTSLSTGNEISRELWAKAVNGGIGTGLGFEVSRTTVIKGRL